MPVQGEPRNININPRDYAKLQLGGQPGVTGGQSGIPGILGLLQQQSNPSIMVPPYKPLRTTADFINRNTDSPDVIQTPRVPGPDPMQQIMAQLQKLMSGGVDPQGFQPRELPQFDPDRYKKQAESSVNAQFAPIIQQILAGQKQTQARAGQNKQAVAGLYQGAVQDVNAGAAKTQQSYDSTQAESKKLYEDERNRIAAGYAADAAAQRAEAKRLGTAALGDNGAGAQQMADKQFADQMGSQQMQSSQSALGQQEAAAGQYNNAIAQATNLEGAEAQQDIMRQLEDYMASSNGDLADTRAQQAGSISDLMMKLAGAGYDRDSQNAQFQYQQERDYIGDQTSLADRQQELLLSQLQAMQGGGQGQGQNGEKLNPWQSVATFADQVAPGQGQDLIGAIQGSMSNRGEIYARSKEDPVPMNPALFAKLIADDPSNQDMPRNQLMQVAQELYRLLYGM
jgi:hypothetical protein